MKVAYVLNTTHANSGATKAFLLILKGMKRFDLQPLVIVPDKGGIYTELQQQGIPVFAFSYRPHTYPYARTWSEILLFLPRLLARLFVNGRAARQIAKALKAAQVQIVHTNVGVVKVGYQAARYARLPHIYHIREYASLAGFHYIPGPSAFYRQLLAPDSYSVCITKDIQRHYKMEGHSRSAVVYDGVFQRKADMPQASQRTYFLFVGRIEPVKGLDQLLDAYAAYSAQTAHPIPLRVAGMMPDTDYCKSLRRFVVEHGLDGSVHFLGDCDHIDQQMLGAKAIIIPSLHEGFGFCMPEAMQQGCLAIARNRAGTKEQLDNGLVSEGQEIALRYETTEQLVQLLCEVATHPENEYDPYRERAFRVVNRLYTMEQCSQQLYSIYQGIAAFSCPPQL